MEVGKTRTGAPRSPKTSISMSRPSAGLHHFRYSRFTALRPGTGTRVTDELPGDVGIVPAFHVGGLVAFELLVGCEERLDLPQPVLPQIFEGPHLVEPRIADGNGEDLLVVAVLVAHEQRADRTGGHDASGERRFFDDDERVQWVAVAADRVHDEPVVSRVMDRREEDSIKTNAARLLVHLVFRTRATRDLYEDVNALIPAPAPHA